MIVVVATLTGSSPLTRGKLLEVLLHGALNGLIPAHAGKTDLDATFGHECPAHPRSRGENKSSHTSAKATRGSSPLTRGKLRASLAGLTRDRLIPAHAGKT